MHQKLQNLSTLYWNQLFYPLHEQTQVSDIYIYQSQLFPPQYCLFSRVIIRREVPSIFNIKLTLSK